MIDAAYGTGFRGECDAAARRRRRPGAGRRHPVGRRRPHRRGPRAGRWRPTAPSPSPPSSRGCSSPTGPSWPARSTVADIGLDVSSARAHLVEAADVAALAARPPPATPTSGRPRCWVVAGSPGHDRRRPPGRRAAPSGPAPATSACSTPGCWTATPRAPSRWSASPLPAAGWADDGARRTSTASGRSCVGPGLGPGGRPPPSVRALVAARRPVAGGGRRRRRSPRSADDGRRGRRRPRRPCSPPTTASSPAWRADAGRPTASAPSGALAAGRGRGRAAEGPDHGRRRSPTARSCSSPTGDARLATAGTGDVLTGAHRRAAGPGRRPARAAAAGAFLHGRAGALAWRRGLVAGDLADLAPRIALSELRSGGLTCPATRPCATS